MFNFSFIFTTDIEKGHDNFGFFSVCSVWKPHFLFPWQHWVTATFCFQFVCYLQKNIVVLLFLWWLERWQHLFKISKQLKTASVELALKKVFNASILNCSFKSSKPWTQSVYESYISTNLSWKKQQIFQK